MSYSLVYVSDVIRREGIDEEAARANLVNLQARALQKNRELGVRGLLVCDSNFYVQWLEGEAATVESLLRTIEADPRHANVQVLHRGDGPAQLDAWSMTLMAPSLAGDSIAANVASLRAGNLPSASHGGTPAAIIRTVLKPGTDLRGQRIGLLGQNGMWSGALASYLSQKWNTPLQRSRLLGSIELNREVLIEFLDRDDPEFGPLSLTHYTGDMEVSPWIQGCVTPMQTAVLLFSGSSEESLIEFAQRALTYLGQANTHAGLLCLFGRSAVRHMSAVERFLRAAGRDIRSADLPMADGEAAWQAIRKCLQHRPPQSPEKVPRPPEARTPKSAVTKPQAQAEAPAEKSSAAPASDAPQAAKNTETREPCTLTLSDAGAAWVELLLNADGVEAVGVARRLTSSGSVLRVKKDDASMAHLREIEVWSEVLPTMHGDPADGGGAQMLIRGSSRLIVLQDLSPHEAVLYVATNDGFVNEGWLRTQLHAAMEQIPASITLGQPGT